MQLGATQIKPKREGLEKISRRDSMNNSYPFVSIFFPNARVSSKHCLMNVISLPGIEAGTLLFPDNHEAHHDTATTSNQSVRDHGGLNTP